MEGEFYTEKDTGRKSGTAGERGTERDDGETFWRVGETEREGRRAIKTARDTEREREGGQTRKRRWRLAHYLTADPNASSTILIHKQVTSPAGRRSRLSSE